jgi:hypothetical protein
LLALVLLALVLLALVLLALVLLAFPAQLLFHISHKTNLLRATDFHNFYSSYDSPLKINIISLLSSIIPFLKRYIKFFLFLNKKKTHAFMSFFLI